MCFMEYCSAAMPPLSGGGFLRPESDGVHEIRERRSPRPLLRVHYSRHDQSGDPLLAVHPVHVVHGNDGLKRLGAICPLPGVHSEPHVEVEGHPASVELFNATCRAAFAASPFIPLTFLAPSAWQTSALTWFRSRTCVLDRPRLFACARHFSIISYASSFRLAL